jgi:hypothetical protein
MDARFAFAQETRRPMIRIRPLVGAVLTALLLASTALADPVEIITPGGNTGLNPPIDGTGPADFGVTELAPTGDSGSSGSSESSSEVDEQPSLQTMHFGAISLACEVASSATDLVVINRSLEPLPAGTRIKWQLKKEGKRGYFAIIGELGGGKSLVADNVLDGRAGRDDVCVARVI